MPENGGGGGTPVTGGGGKSTALCAVVTGCTGLNDSLKADIAEKLAAAAAAAAAEAGSNFSFTKASSCFFRALLSFALLF